MSENTSPNSQAPSNTSFFSENIGMKVGALESDVKHITDSLNKIESRITPLETWKSEVVGGWKTARWIIGILWIAVSAIVPLAMKALGLI